MSSEDDNVVLEKHRGKVATGLARPGTARRKSKESQSSKLSQVVAINRQSRDVQPSRKSATAAAAPPDDDSDDDAHMLQKHQNKLLTHVKVPVKSVAAEKLKIRSGLLQPGHKALERSTSIASTGTRRPPVQAADSDSDPEPTSRSLLSMRLGNTSQAGRTQPANAAQNKPFAAASSDSDDELVYAQQPKQSQSLSAKQAAQSGSMPASKSAVRPDSSRATVLKVGKLGSTADRRASRDSTAEPRSGLITQASLQQSTATGSSALMNRQKGMTQVHAGPAKAADTSDADSDEEHWKSLSAKAAKPKLQLQTVKPVKALQAETSEDFSSADEWQTAKAGLRRASVEQATSSSAAAVRPPSCRTTAERQPVSRGSTAIPLVLPTRPSATPINRLQPQAMPVPTSAPKRASNLAQRSRLNRSVTDPPDNSGAESSGAMTGLHAQVSAGAVNSGVVTGYRLHAIPEGAEESPAQTVPQQDLDLLYSAGEEQFSLAPAYDSEAALMSAAVAAESAAMQQQAAAIPAAIPSSPRAAAHASSRRLQATQSSSTRHPRAGEQPERAEQAAQRAGLLSARPHRYTERAPETRLLPEAGQVSEAIQPLSLLQLAEADIPNTGQQWPNPSPPGLSLLKGQPRESPSGAAYQADLPVGNEAGPSGAGDHDRLEGGRANSGGAPLQLQQLQTSLVQTLTFTVESAMAQIRADMQQLDGKWSQWWRQSSDMCDNLQHQMSLLCSQQEVTTQRMQQLETQVAQHKQPQQAVPLDMGDEGYSLGREDPRVSSVLERLSQLEGRVGTQLDQLLQLQQQQKHLSGRSKSGSPAKRSRGAGGGDEHADWLVSLGEQLGGLQAQMQTAASTSSLQAVQHETAALRSALDARSAEASLYRKQYEGLCRKLDSLEEQQRQASAAARAKEKSEQASAAALDNRLTTLEAHASRAQQEAAAANSTSNNLQQRFAAMEWRVEQTASSCAATLRTMTAKHERLAGTLAVVKEAANFAEAKCSALGSELARMHRQSARTGDTKENKPFTSAITSASTRS
ncbi:TPA: hypothetical protein ACH3X1_003700 [Trebouxia sp. C0004]